MTNELTQAEINDLIKLTQFEIEQMKENRAKAFKYHEKLPPSEFKRIEQETKYFHDRAIQLREKLNDFVKTRDGMSKEREKEISIEKKQEKDRDRGR
ncbi:hypothetical protein [uncultured Dokdonia sp.]|uniref:hypothetical protein n=1 Tax=uncultured Dokdonia sp. TaxID=575653 RepID=UPI00260473A5|nr:hypothetical protein [uncultured Dokdonia sp.]